MTPKPDYRVTFWRQPYVEPGELSEGVGQEGVMEITGARDVVEVLDWRPARQRVRGANLTLYAVVDRGGKEA